ncbi:MAG: hypothetical protein EPO22_11455 [Dehalococcoidia bacterium]|nr:MAG: hypothetical protein EPO22_11455 [Dehalococcoidia bacterium]
MKIAATLAAGMLIVTATALAAGTGDAARAALSDSPAGTARRSATFSVGSGGAHPLNESFTVDVLLSDVVFGTSTSWHGYDFELDYDPSVLLATSVSPGLCPIADRSAPAVTPAVSTGCLFQTSTATAGVLETVTFVCVGNGTSTLRLPALPGHLAAGNVLFDDAANSFSMALNNGAATCDGSLPTATNTPEPSATSTPVDSPTPTSTPNGSPDSGTLAMSVPADAQVPYQPFLVAAVLSTFTPISHPYWAGYDVELAYDSTMLKIDYAAPVLCPRSHWGNPSTSPSVVTGCFGLESAATGVLENMVVRCLRPGTTALHLVPSGDPSASYVGTGVFDVTGDFHFALTLQDATVTCGQRVDDDGDGCGNTMESDLGLNPLNPWDFYSVPAPALIGAPDPRLAMKSDAVAAGDAQAIFAYFAAAAKAGTPAYDQDLNANGIKDGIEYDRSFAGAARSGPADGVIAASDAQLAFAQFTLGYKC